MKSFAAVAFLLLAVYQANACTVTTVSGTKAPSNFCSGDLIFEDNFNSLDQSKWRHEISLGGGGNWEFQWYVNDRFNSYTAGGILHLKPTFTSSIFGENFLTSGRIIIPPNECTQSDWYGCDRQGTPDSILNPIRSARVDTWDSFHFKYGTVEIRAKMPAGDWIWPALWLMPRRETYGGWPRSGEIDLMEMRGNRNLFNGNTNVGVEQAGSTMHWGPEPWINGWGNTHWNRNRVPGFDADFHLYKLVWTPTYIEFIVDNVSLGRVDQGEGFWKRAGWDRDPNLTNPWTSGTLMAPFDHEFFLIMNVAVGGVNYFADSFVNRDHPKPWLNTSPYAPRDFWRARSDWEPTWNLNTEDSHMQVDYVRVWAL